MFLPPLPLLHIGTDATSIYKESDVPQMTTCSPTATIARNLLLHLQARL
jgi:hypothetical protein